MENPPVGGQLCAKDSLNRNNVLTAMTTYDHVRPHSLASLKHRDIHVRM